jgi:hypothetical protein
MDQGVVLNSYCWPAGFFADVNYMIDVPIILNKNHKNYKFDKLTRVFYSGMLEYFAMEKTNHAYRLFGCDMAFIDAKVNYRIMEALIDTWNQLGFNEVMELKFSTATRYVNAVSQKNNQEVNNKTNFAWPIRRDDTFPYAQNPNQYWSGYYSTRP